ncbi:MAG: hypothetical protein K2I03_02545 [Lachnospiraceae bacterium]|nr:hypothetical protein [Lachnospiraceae bacterium]
MEDFSYKYHDNEGSNISLHDCRATSTSVNNGILSFYFPDGFWLGENHSDNYLKKTVRTDESKVDFHLVYKDVEDITIYIFTEEKKGKTIREECDLKNFISCINDGSYELEFLYQYKGYNSIILNCWIWFNEKPYSKECELVISTSKTAYYWNKLCEDRSW